MAAAVCRGLMSWSDPDIHHTHGPIPSSFRFSPYSCSGGTSNCSFLEAISAGERPAKDDDGRWPVPGDNVYVHPLVVGTPSLRLTQKSLELCTENLGNETGSDVSDSESALSGVFSSTTTKEERPSKPLHGRMRKAEKYEGFPPPLTTIKGTGAAQFKTHREQGRLVIEAVRTSSTNAVFRAERSQGRLTLSFVDNPARISLHYEEEDQEYRNQENGDKTEGYEDNVEAVDGRALKSPNRCKDSDHRCHQLQHENRGLSCWETFWVATS